jgi:hypothetical protein
MTWHEVVSNPDFAGLPFKIETNEFGQVVMSPASFIKKPFRDCCESTSRAVGSRQSAQLKREKA